MTVERGRKKGTAWRRTKRRRLEGENRMNVGVEGVEKIMRWQVYGGEDKNKGMKKQTKKTVKIWCRKMKK